MSQIEPTRWLKFLRQTRGGLALPVRIADSADTSTKKRQDCDVCVSTLNKNNRGLLVARLL
jgi:hypothetical protein